MLNIFIMCKLVGVAQTAKGSWRMAFVTPQAQLFTVYVKDDPRSSLDSLTADYELREFRVDLSDKFISLIAEKE